MDIGEDSDLDVFEDIEDIEEIEEVRPVEQELREEQARVEQERLERRRERQLAFAEIRRQRERRLGEEEEERLLEAPETGIRIIRRAQGERPRPIGRKRREQLEALEKVRERERREKLRREEEQAKLLRQVERKRYPRRGYEYAPRREPGESRYLYDERQKIIACNVNKLGDTTRGDMVSRVWRNKGIFKNTFIPVIQDLALC